MANDTKALEAPAHKYLVTSTPHIRSKDTVSGIMLDVLIALCPAVIMASYYFGYSALIIIGLSVGSSVFFEYLYQKITKQKSTINDLSAVVTGLLLAFNLPSTVPFWLPIVGSAFAIILVKQIFGGIGQNFVNPALAARAFLLTSYAGEMTNFSVVPLKPDAVTTATPLALLKLGEMPSDPDYISALLGTIGGCIGETCKIALILGGLYLILRRVIKWHTPVIYLGTVALLSFVFGRNGLFTGVWLYELIVGGLILGAFFMATDYTTSPMSVKGTVIYAVGCGILTFVIRLLGGYPEGVSYSILIMNLAVPLIDKYTKPKVFGVFKEAKNNA